MIIRLLATQIPMFWETIKYVACEAEIPDSVTKQAYLNELLHSLLNDKSQCFAKLNNDKVLDYMILTRLVIDKFTNDRILIIEAFDYFRFVVDTNATWENDMQFIIDYAKQQKCKIISFKTKHGRVWAKRFQNLNGFGEAYRVYQYKIGGV